MAEPVRIVGEAKLLHAFSVLPERIQRKHVRRGVTKGGRLIAKRAKSLVHKRTGLLKLSIGQKVRTYKDKGLILVAVGPRRGFKRRMVLKHLKRGGTRKGYGKKGESGGGQMINPTRYAATVESLHPYLRPAWDSQKGAAFSVVKQEIATGIQAEAAKVR